MCFIAFKFKSKGGKLLAFRVSVAFFLGFFSVLPDAKSY